ncbi:MAG: lipopolysaccharide biosynthesis protein [Methylomicrobium sp.]
MSAHGYGQLVTILSTMFIPSVAVAKWGAEGYGYWVTLSALAQFFLMTDLGAATALSNQLCLKSARTVEEAWVLVRNVLGGFIIKALSAAVIIVAISVFVWSYYDREDASEQAMQLAIVFISLALSAALQPLIGIYGAVWRFIGKNAVGIFVSNTVRSIELLGILGCALLGRGILAAAVTALALRFIAATVGVIHTPRLLLRGSVARKTRQSKNRRKSANAELVSVKLAGHGFMLISLSQQLALHAPVLLISTILGPTSAAVFAACRTISRLPVQPLTVVLASLNPEFTELVASRQHAQLAKIVRRVVVVAIIVSLMVGAGAVLYANVLERVWLAGKLNLDLKVLTALCIAASFYIGGQVLNQTLTAANRTRNQSRQFIVMTMLLVVLMVPLLMFTNQMLWVAVLVLISESIMAVLLIRRYSIFLSSQYIA